MARTDAFDALMSGAGAPAAQSPVTARLIGIAADGAVSVPDGISLVDAEFHAQGSALVITGEDGQRVIVEGWFDAVDGGTPVLVDGDGARITPAIVQSFLWPLAPGQSAQIGGATGTAIGAIDSIEGDATVRRTDGRVEPLSEGSAIFLGDVVETAAGGTVAILFADETSFTIGSDARIAIDDYLYDGPDEGGETMFSMLKGVFVYVSGLIAREDPANVTINTPAGTLGIRGTIIIGDVDNVRFTLVEGGFSFDTGTQVYTVDDEFGTLSRDVETGGFSTEIIDSTRADTFYGTVRTRSPQRERIDEKFTPPTDDPGPQPGDDPDADDAPVEEPDAPSGEEDGTDTGQNEETGETDETDLAGTPAEELRETIRETIANATGDGTSVNRFRSDDVEGDDGTDGFDPNDNDPTRADSGDEETSLADVIADTIRSNLPNRTGDDGEESDADDTVSDDPANDDPISGEDDPEPLPTVALAGPGTLSEAADAAIFSVNLGAAFSQPVEITWIAEGTATSGGAAATEGSDFFGTGGTLVIEPGATSATIALPLTNDATDEFAEGITVTITEVVGGELTVASATATLSDDDPAPTLVLDSLGLNADGTAIIAIASLSAPSEKPIGASWTLFLDPPPAAAGAPVALNFDPINLGTIDSSLTPGQTGFNLSFPAEDLPAGVLRLEVSGLENVALDDGAGNGFAPQPFTGTLPKLTITAPTSVDEDAGLVTVTLSLDKAAEEPITVELIVTPNDGGEPGSGIVTFPAGAISAELDLQVIDDGIASDGNETVTLSVGAISGADFLQGPIVIGVNENDNAPVWDDGGGPVDLGTFNPGDPISFDLAASDADGDPVGYRITQVLVDGVPSAAAPVSIANGVLTGNFSELDSAQEISVTVEAFDTPAGFPDDSNAVERVIDFRVEPEGDGPSIQDVTGPPAGSYGVGATLTFSVVFDAPVFLADNSAAGATPSFKFQLGDGFRSAVLTGGLGTSSLNFSYTVTAGDLDTDGLNAVALELGGAVLEDENGSLANSETPAKLFPGIQIDTVGPTISSVTIPPGTYDAGDVIVITVRFSEAISVETDAAAPGGLPTLALILANGETRTAQIGDPPVAQEASVPLIDNVTELTFLYTVTDEDPDTNGLTTSPVLSLNGAQIVDSFGNPSAIALPVNIFPQVVVDDGINSVTDIITPPSGTYDVGDVLTFVVVFQSAITNVSGNPTLQVEIGGVVKELALADATAAGTLEFSYTVAAGDDDSDGITIKAINPAGAIITSQNGQPIEADFADVNLPSVIVDDGIPAISAITVISPPADNTYGPGENVVVRVSFDTPVSVDTSGGTPTLKFAVGDDAEPDFIAAVLQNPPAAGTQVTSLEFSFSVDGLNDPDGLVVDSLLLNGGSIESSNGIGADLTIPDNDLANYVIDTEAPAIQSVQPPADDTYYTGQDLSFIVSFDEPVSLSQSGGPPRIELTINGQTRYAVADLTGIDGDFTSLTFTYTIEEDLSDGDGIEVGSAIDLQGASITDAGGNEPASLALPIGPLTGVEVAVNTPPVFNEPEEVVRNDSDPFEVALDITDSEQSVGELSVDFQVIDNPDGIFSAEDALSIGYDTGLNQWVLEVDPVAARDAPDGDEAAVRILIDDGVAPQVEGIVTFQIDGKEDPSTLVTTALDVVDSDDGLTSLREAINAVNAGDINLPLTQEIGPPVPGPGPTITFDPSLSGQTIQLGTSAGGQGSALGITEALTIDGDINGDGTADITISGNDSTAIFDIGGDHAGVTLTGLILTDGFTSGDGGAISTSLDLTLDGVTVQDSEAGVRGGGIYVDTDSGAMLTVTDSTITGNSSASKGGGIHAGSGLDLSNSTVTENTVDGGDTVRGGGIFIDSSGGTISSTITNSTISDNQAINGSGSSWGGGGIWADSGVSLTVNDSTIENNESGQIGGGLYARDFLTISDSTISGNEAKDHGGGIHASDGLDGERIVVESNLIDDLSGRGGGIYIDDNDTNSGGASIIDSSLIRNNTAPDYGGGIYTDADPGLTVTNTTITGNQALNDGNGKGGGIFNDKGVSIDSSTIIDNSADDSQGGGLFNNSGETGSAINSIIGGDIAGSGIFDTNGFNLFNQTPPVTLGTGDAVVTDGAGDDADDFDLFFVEDLPGSENSIGGFIPNATSPAVDAGSSSPLIVDAGGRARPVDGDGAGGAADDIGAVERQTGDPSQAGANETPSLLVTTLDDIANPMDNETSLREAIGHVNAGTLSGTITFDSGLSGVIVLTQGTLFSQSDFTIDGDNRITISGDVDQNGQAELGDVRPFLINFLTDVELRNLTIERGHASGSGGAILTNGTLSLTNVTIRESVATLEGGGVYVSTNGSLEVSQSTFTNNFAQNYGGAIASIRPMTITGSHFEGNLAEQEGGAIFFNDDDGTAIIDRSSFIANDAWVSGGGIQINNGSATLANSTIADNNAGTIGGGINAANSAELFLFNNTVLFNEGAEGGDDQANFDINSSVEIVNSIFDSGIVGAFTSGGSNLFADNSEDFDLGEGGPGPNDSFDVTDFGLGALSILDGVVQGYLPESGSIAIDAGDSDLIFGVLDAAGNDRLIDGDGDETATVDIGAVEAPAPAVIASAIVTIADDLVDANDGETSLREAITAVQDGTLTGPITFASGLTNLIVTSQFTITSAVTIVGPGTDAPSPIDLAGTGTSRIFQIANGGSLSLEGLTVRNGYSAFSEGGAIYNQGSLMLDDVEVKDSQSLGSLGGGLYNDAGASATILDSAITGNLAINSESGGDGGGIYNAGTLTLTGSEVSLNEADLYGGGIYNSGTLVVSNSHLEDNDAGTFGGGFYFASGTVASVLDASSIIGNRAEYGAGLYASNASFAVTNTVIGQNEAEFAGGGIKAENGGTVQLINATLVENLQGSASQQQIYQGSGTVIQIGNSIVDVGINGSLSSLGNNLFADGTVAGAIASDLTGVTEGEVDLGDLGIVGGVVQGYVPGPDSIAIDAGNDALVSGSIDAGGGTRQLDGDGDETATVDIGAVEAPANFAAVAAPLSVPERHFGLEVSGGESLDFGTLILLGSGESLTAEPQAEPLPALLDVLGGAEEGLHFRTMDGANEQVGQTLEAPLSAHDRKMDGANEAFGNTLEAALPPLDGGEPVDLAAPDLPALGSDVTLGLFSGSETLSAAA